MPGRIDTRTADRAPSAEAILRRMAWPLSLVLLMLLAAVRAASHAEFAFASLALLPVMGVAWLVGLGSGLAMAALAAATWVVGDLASDRSHAADWIPWANGAIRLLIYGLVAVLAATVRRQAQADRRHARRDDLTGLHNRRHFVQSTGRAVARARRRKTPLAALFLDLDHFKALNDKQGHALGDEALKATAAALLAATRPADLVARLGGDEFVVLLPGLSLLAAHRAAQRVSARVNAALVTFPGLSVSLGAVWFGEHAPQVPALLAATDGVMYRAKRRHRGGVVVEDQSRAWRDTLAWHTV